MLTYNEWYYCEFYCKETTNIQLNEAVQMLIEYQKLKYVETLVDVKNQKLVK
jgi:hypothetical protein